MNTNENNKILQVIKNKQVQKWIVETVIAIVFAFCMNILVFKVIMKKDYGYCGYALWLAVCLIVFVLYKMRNIAVKRMEILFAVTALILGTFYIAVSPATVGTSWDDQIHYGRTVSAISHLTGGKYNKADEDDIASATEIAASFAIEQQKVGLLRNTRKDVSDRLNSEYRSGERGNDQIGDVTFQAVAYIPAGIGLVIGRIMRLPWTFCFNIGRFFTLLSYVTIISIAISRLNNGKVICALIGLMPSSVFMASSYSYDPWVISWSILGFTEFFNIFSDKDTKISNRKWLKMLLIFFIAFLPKMVYVVMLLPLFFIDSGRFENRKQAVILKTVIFAMAVILAVVYAVPEMLRGALLAGDTRGGEGVNPMGQVSFFLHNPGRAGKIILKFAVNYVGLSEGGNYLQKFAYFGDGAFESVTWIALASGILLEERETSLCPKRIRITGIIGIALGVLVVILSLYIAFNPVGSENIQGVQNRYLFPLFFPLGYYLIPGSVRVKLEKESIAVYPIAVMALTFIYNIYMLCIYYY